MESDLLQLILDIMDGKETEVQWSDKTTVGVVLASDGYPASSTLDEEIFMMENLD